MSIKKASIILVSLLFLFSCDPCRNGKSCHRSGDKAKKKQVRTSKNNHRNQAGGGFSLD